ncbi:MAG: FtsX-like permease family protein, partial [Bacteroidota bacterium]
ALGGYSQQLVIQFLAETTLITFIALLCSLVVSEFLFIQLEDVIDTRLELNLFQNIETIGFLFALLVTVSLLSGFYPSFLLAGMNTVMALKSKITAKNNSGGLGLRKVLVITQFTISQFLIIGTVIISSQMSFFMTKDLGFEKEAIVKTYLPETDEVKSERFRSLMQENSAISGVTFALSSPSGTSNAVSIFNYPPLESEQDYMANYKPVDEHYMDLYGLDLIAGRNIKKSDSGNYVIINRKTADLLGFKDNYDEVVGEQLSSGWRGYRLKVIGVMENFHSQDLSGGLQYVFLLNEPETYFEIAFKTLEGSNVKQAISHFESVWDQVYPEYVVDWQFYDEELAENYEQEQSVSTLMSIFSIVSIAIGCLGLYGLIAFITANRTKEVGIRKALGAPVVAIIGKFTREIFILIVISFLIAAPVAFFILNEWLNDYEFRIKIGFGFFAMAFIATLLIAALTVGYRTISTAQLNPAQTLKDE